MLNPFPHLLVFSFFAPTLLRLAVAGVFFYLAIFHLKNHKTVAREISVIDYSVALWLSGLFTLVEGAVAVFLLVGFLTQIAALVGAIICLKIFFIKRGLRHISPLSHLAYILLAIICLSLLMTGAGAFAFDVPL